MGLGNLKGRKNMCKGPGTRQLVGPGTLEHILEEAVVERGLAVCEG